ncbi:secondary thiamine-phosphate synthase enzyme YjbQ [Hydrogenimonas sp.]
MRIEQARIALAPKRRGIHLVSREIFGQLSWLEKYESGLLHLFLQHTSAALSLNENADPDVRGDAARFLDHLVPDGWGGFEHTLEGLDDMPAHMKSMLLGVGLTIPVSGGRPALGTWQGVYLIEGRDRAGARHIVATIVGEERA